MALQSTIKFVIELDGRDNKHYQLTFWRNSNGSVGIEVKGNEFLAVSTSGESPVDILKMAQILQ